MAVHRPAVGFPLSTHEAGRGMIRRRRVSATWLLAVCSALFGASAAGASTAPSSPGSNGTGVGATDAFSLSALAGRGTAIQESRRGTFVPSPADQAGQLHLGAGYTFNPSAAGGTDLRDQIPENLRGLEPGPSERGYFLVQFEGPIEASDRALLERRGVEIVRYVPDYAFLVRMTGADKTVLAANPAIHWVGLYEPAFKLSTLPQMSEPGVRDMLVLLFPHEDITAASGEIALAGGIVKETSDNGINRLLLVSMDTARAADVARVSSVAWIEPRLPMLTNNNQDQWVVQTNTNNSRRVWDMGIKGQNQVVSVGDTGIRVTHNQFKDPAVPLPTFGDYPTHRKVIGYQRTTPSANITFGDEALNSYHGTHTSCTTAGDDAPNASDARDGMAINAKIYFMDGGGGPDAGVLIPLDLNDMLIIPYTGNAGGAARIMSNSWGSAIGGAYDIQAMAADQFMSNHPDFLLFFSNGNNGAANTVGSPATAKNVVSAGGTGNGTSSNTYYSSTSRGPTDDNRIKPTICAPATLASAFGSGDTGYTTLSGTSMACPSMAGATVLIRQYLTDGWYPTGAAVGANGFPPSAALMKAMAVNSADPNIGSFTIPDNNIGWGRIDIDNALYFGGDTRRLAVVDNSEGLLTGEFVEYQVYVAANTQSLKATLVWTDSPGNPANSVQLVNDLNLVVSDGTNSYKGNVYSGGQSATGGSADARNVEECVQRNTPAVGVWTVRVEGANVPIGPQSFALVVTGALASDNGILVLNQPAYSGTDVVQIKLIDTNAAGSIQVAVSSDTETTPETVTLSGANGVFTGSVALTLNGVSGGNGQVSVSDGDILTVAYNDASPAVTIRATATINISGPAISSVHAVEINEADVTIAWTTSTPANSRIYYGTTPGLGSDTGVTGGLSVGHAVTLSGLAANTLYYYDVESYDNQGNGVRDNNGGLHYTVSTDQNRDVLVVIGDGTFDKTNYYANALVRSGWTYTIWEGAQATTPYVGNLAGGMASYKAVVWQTGLEQYPMFGDAAKDSVQKLNTLGSRTTVYSNDLAWDFCDPASPDDTPARCNFVQNDWHVSFQDDPLTFTSVRGIASDPISGSYTGGIPYTPHRDGAACDEIDGVATGGTFNYVWRNNDATADDIAVRWTSSGNVGTAGQSVWGGTPRKVVSNLFEWAHLNVANADDVTRADVLDKTLIWLIGHRHPTATVLSPNGGSNEAGPNVSISWSETVDSGFSIANRKIYYSDNGGDSWTLISGAAGPSPFSWNITAIPNGAQYRVKVVVSDNASPALSSSDASNSNFAVARSGGDTRGPVVLAGSVAVDPNPVVKASPAVVTATVSDVNQGNSNIQAAEYSFGGAPAPAGSGTAMSGTFTSSQVNVSLAIDTSVLPAGTTTLWVRGRDAAGNWGNASGLLVQVNSVGADVQDGAMPKTFALYANSPNPFRPSTFIRFDLPTSTAVTLSVYDLSGRRVRSLVEGAADAGAHAIEWDGMDDAGRAVGSGVYFYRLEAGTFRATRKMTLLK